MVKYWKEFLVCIRSSLWWKHSWYSLGKIFLPKPLSNLLLVVKVLWAGFASMSLCFVDKFPLNRLTLNICQIHPFLTSFCQLWLTKLPLNVSSFRVTQQKSGKVEGSNSSNLEDFVSEPLFVPFIERHIFLRYSNFVSWFPVWFSDQSTQLLRYLCSPVCYMLRGDLDGCQSCYAIDSIIDCVKTASRLWSEKTICSPNVCKWSFGRSNIPLCECRFRFSFCGVSVNVFALTELFESSLELISFIRPLDKWSPPGSIWSLC